MKFYLSSLLLMLCSSFAHAQLEQGTWLVGGSGSFSKIQNDNNSTGTAIHLNPRIGYFISDKLVTGIQTMYSYQTNRFAGNGLNDNFLIIGPYIRYYILNNEHVLNLLTELGYNYGKYNTDGIYTITGTKNSYFSLACGPTIFLNSAVGIESTVVYIFNSLKNYGIQFNIGVGIYLFK